MKSSKLFKEIFLINSFTFGGGYTIIPIIEQKFVEELNLINKDDMKNIISLANSVPGALAISTSFLVGYKVKGILGAVISTLAAILPCILIIAFIFNMYSIFITNTYIKSAMLGVGIVVSAILLSTVIKMFLNLFKQKKRNIFLIIFIIAFISSYFFGVNIVLILLMSSILGSGII